MKLLCIKVFTSSGSQDHVIFLAEVKPNKKKRKDDISIEIIRERNQILGEQKKINKQRPQDATIMRKEFVMPKDKKV